MIKFFTKGLVTTLCLLIVVVAVHADPAKPRKFVSHFENILGTSLELKIVARTETEADIAESAALEEIARISHILSAYDPKSEFSRWLNTHNQPVSVSKELFEVLQLFDTWRSRSGGALNASAEGINKLWKQAANRQQLPAEQELSAVVVTAQQQQWKLDAANQTAEHLGNSPLMLNSFAKSYIINHAATAAMNAAPISAIVVNIGGDIVVRGQLDERVMISDPKQDAENDKPLTGVLVANKAIATSGNYRRGVQIGDRWYSHIVDPRTGWPSSEVISATVIAPNATDAGALATAFNVLTPQESEQLAASVPGAAYLLVTKEGKRISSKGWNEMELPAETAARISTLTAAADWADDYELAVNFEIALIEGTRVRRPFVAVWLEDGKGNPVRNISVWFNRDRWLPDLKLWHRHYWEKFKAEGSVLKTSVSSATRSPGKYTVKWDGKDDAGAVVKPGKYTVVIEAAREHGTYQVIRQEIEIKRKPSAQSITLTGNAEIASASLELRKKTAN